MSGSLVSTPSSPRSGAPAPRTLAFAVEAMGGTWLGSVAPAVTFVGATMDSRLVTPGQLFFALSGERVDGYDFCAAAATAGAAALVVDARRGMPQGLGAAPGRGGAPVPVIGVSDPLAALADLARAVRATFTGRVVGITGSNGKTTTKELTAAALGSAGRVLRTEGSYNTEIGLPLTILSASGAEEFWVLEMAMRGRGQIALLVDIARPHVGVITNVAGAHLALLGSLEEVARAKGELFAGLDAEGIAVLPGGDALIEAQAQELPEARKVRFDGGDRGPKDVVILDSLPGGIAGQVVRFSVRRQPVVAHLRLGGLHNARNAAAALAVAAAFDLPAPAAAAALRDTILAPHRSLLIDVAGRIVLDDCYNANPASMRAALTALVASASGAPGQGRAFAILGDMLETGPDAPELHRALGREFGTRLGGLAVLGPLGAEIGRGAVEMGLDPSRVLATDNSVAAAATVAAWTGPGDWILVKASRAMRLERAIAALTEELALKTAASGPSR